MKIKTKINALLVSGSLLVALVGSVMFFADRDITADLQVIQANEKLIHSSAQLRLLAVETILYREERASDQWQRKIHSIKDELQTLEISLPAARATLARIRKNIDSAEAIHRELALKSVLTGHATPTPAAEESAFAARNFAALTLVIQDVIDSADQLVRASRLKLEQSLRTQRIAFGLMLLAMVAQLAFMWRLSRGSILQPLTTFVGATQRVAAGDYTFRLNFTQQDEIGVLARSFDEMNDRVQDMNETLRQSEENISITLNSIGDAVIATDAAGLITRMNPVAERLTGWPLADAMGQPLTAVFHIISAQTRLPSVNPVQLVMERGQVVGLANHTALLARDGHEYQIADSAAPIRDANNTIVGVVLVFSDVTEKYRAQEALRGALREKTALLLEVHHRVKNNLQIITSLLRLESFRSTDAPTKSVLQDMQGRVRSMALLHETIYRKGTFAAIDLGIYVGQVAGESLKSMQVNPGTVRLQLDMETLQVGLDQATPTGMLVSELVSNCLKHAFPDGHTGEIGISLHPLDTPGQWRLQVSDSGIGLPPDFEERRKTSLGLQLAGDMATQMGGTLHVGAGPQAVFTVDFKAEVPASLKINLGGAKP